MSTREGRKKSRTKKTSLKSLGAWVRRDCESMTKHLVARRALAVSDLQAPKDRAPLEEWIQHYGHLRALIWADSSPMDRADEAEESMLAALREEPVEVALLGGDIVKVYPKGLDSLMWFRHHDWFMGWLAPRLSALRESLDEGAGTKDDIPRPVAMLERAEAELGHQVAMFCAEACHPGPSKGPWASTDDTQEPLPDQWGDMEPHDIAAVHRGFVIVNAVRLQALEQIVKPRRGERDEGSMSWNVFMGTMATQLQIDPASLARNRSLVSLLATVRLARESEPDMPAAK